VFDPEKFAKKFEDPARDQYHRWSELFQHKQLAGRSDLVAVDIGGGTGYVAIKMAETKMFKKIFSADVSEDMCEYVRNRLEKSEYQNVIEPVLAQEDFFSLPEQVDFIITVNAYHHFREHADFFAKLARTHAKAGCTLLIVDYKPGKLIKEGTDEEIGPKEHWKVKVPQEKVIETIANSWQFLDSMEFQYHYNLFFIKK
jgi:cyclopropane fatty-acyl-phospholipid synthase-like methyltransferase